jgi:hypothetical protein
MTDGTTMMARFRQFSDGSALILTVVLTSLLAIVGVLFLMAARIDKMATSAAVDNEQLTFAVDSVVAQIRDVLAQDLPRPSSRNINVEAQEYYDYPDPCNAWLADLEPNDLKAVPNPSNPKQNLYRVRWHQISDIMKDTTGRSIGDTTDVNAVTVGEREPIIDSNSIRANADADGDGVGDARWFAMPGVASSKGKPIYAAVRIVDNGAMLNLNTGYKFDPNAQSTSPSDIDGHSQLQVNVLALAAQPGILPVPLKATELLAARATSAAAAMNLAAYEQEVIWGYDYGDKDPAFRGRYVPFDLSDELELRYRYLLDQQNTDTRSEKWGWFRRPAKVIWTPVDADGNDLRIWYSRATQIEPNIPADPNLKSGALAAYYAYRHIATAYNLDRVLTPRPLFTRPGGEARKMVNVNDIVSEEGLSADTLSRIIDTALAGVSPADHSDPAQIAANIVDYIDADNDANDLNDVTVTWGTGTTSEYYGFERPCIYLSELAYRFVLDRNTNVIHRSYAVELCKPYSEDKDPGADHWSILINNPTGADPNEIITWSGGKQFHLLLSLNSSAPLPAYDPADPNQPSSQTPNTQGFRFGDGAKIELRRQVIVGNGVRWLTVDRIDLGDHAGFVREPDANNVDVYQLLQRDISPEKCILRLWGSPATTGKSLGNGRDNFVSTDPRKIQAHPANEPLTNIGELGKIFAHSAYTLRMPELAAPGAEDLLINLALPASDPRAGLVYENLFNYLTVIDPAKHNLRLEATEMRVKGRININTAPIFVLAQLPWMRQPPEAVPFERPRAIVEYRNKYGPFKSIGGLMRVGPMQQLASDGVNNLYNAVPRGPDLTPDKVTDDLEERDLFFTRISNLVTVRSDVFTAYILVRIGLDGPQKRVVAILDRSLATEPGDPVRILSLEQVPDPR